MLHPFLYLILIIFSLCIQDIFFIIGATTERTKPFPKSNSRGGKSKSRGDRSKSRGDRSKSRGDRSKSRKGRIDPDDLDAHLNSTSESDDEIPEKPSKRKTGTKAGTKAETKAGTKTESKNQTKVKSMNGNKGGQSHGAKQRPKSGIVPDSNQAKVVNVNIEEDSETEVAEDQFITPEFPKPKRKTRVGREIHTPLRKVPLLIKSMIDVGEMS